jgi:hypothetical protein
MQKTQAEDVLSLALYCAIKSFGEMLVKETKSGPLARRARGNLRQQVSKRDSHNCQYSGCDEIKYLLQDQPVPAYP